MWWSRSFKSTGLGVNVSVSAFAADDMHRTNSRARQTKSLFTDFSSDSEVCSGLTMNRAGLFADATSTAPQSFFTVVRKGQLRAAFHKFARRLFRAALEGAA